MKLNIFQKIAFFVYISVLILICTYFVPYYYHSDVLDKDKFLHSSLINGNKLIYFRFLIYVFIPSLIFYFIYKYLDKMNDLEPKIYKQKGKIELYVFFGFISIFFSTVFFFYGFNFYLNKNIELEKERNSINKVLYYRIFCFERIPSYNFIGYKWSENVFYSYISEPNFKKKVYKYLLENGHTSYSEDIFNSKIGEESNELLYKKLNSVESALKEKQNKSYSNKNINLNIIITFIILFISLYITRPLFFVFKDMIKEVN